jgi:hypothetical protein
MRSKVRPRDEPQDRTDNSAKRPTNHQSWRSTKYRQHQRARHETDNGRYPKNAVNPLARKNR